MSPESGSHTTCSRICGCLFKFRDTTLCQSMLQRTGWLYAQLVCQSLWRAATFVGHSLVRNGLTRWMSVDAHSLGENIDLLREATPVSTLLQQNPLKQPVYFTLLQLRQQGWMGTVLAHPLGTQPSPGSSSRTRAMPSAASTCQNPQNRENWVPKSKKTFPTTPVLGVPSQKVPIFPGVPCIEMGMFDSEHPFLGWQEMGIA